MSVPCPDAPASSHLGWPVNFFVWLVCKCRHQQKVLTLVCEMQRVCCWGEMRINCCACNWSWKHHSKNVITTSVYTAPFCTQGHRGLLEHLRGAWDTMTRLVTCQWQKVLSKKKNKQLLALTHTAMVNLVYLFASHAHFWTVSQGQRTWRNPVQTRGNIQKAPSVELTTFLWWGAVRESPHHCAALLSQQLKRNNF